MFGSVVGALRLLSSWLEITSRLFGSLRTAELLFKEPNTNQDLFMAAPTSIRLEMTSAGPAMC